MRVMVETDLEGVAGVMNAPDWIHFNSRYYEVGKKLLTEEINAAVDGLFAAGATRIVVSDGHGPGAINGLLLDERVELKIGWGRLPYGNCTIRDYDCVVWVGQHPKARTLRGHLCHTGSFDVLERTINGIAVGEFGQDAFGALEHGVVPIFGSGCRAFTEEAQELFPGIGTVSVKQGLMDERGDDCTAEEYEEWNAGAIHLSHPKACRLIRDGAFEALTRFREHPETFCRDFPAPPYTLVEKYRAGRGHAEPYTVRFEHPTSITGVLNRQFE